MLADRLPEACHELVDQSYLEALQITSYFEDKTLEIN